ncbi:SusE domain-containing protein [Aegicerativicinus sediminis]|uniref:SusE domain-containing protein n=1 Tax=Aegicerativicinus sediminis TaxID=2893202 RepID=UPI001E38BA17|nr:SusE domain-containing protein [Aegicerativicinus sediminis]
MKKIFTLLLTLLIITSCNTDDVEDRPIIEASGNPVVVAPETGASYELDFNKPTALVDRFVWEPADFNGDVAITYTVEVDNVGNNFADPQVLGSTIGGNQISFTVSDLNNLVLALGATPFSNYQVEARVKASVSDSFEPQYSETIVLNVTPYTTEAPKIAVPGNHQGWAPSSAPRLAASGFGETDYEGYVWLDGGHKFVGPDANGNFDWGNTDWGDDGTFTGKLAEEGESDCTATAGYYLIKVDTEALTYSETEYSEWGLIGDATPTGWDSDTDMVYDSASGTWSVDIYLTANKIKFRANNNWDWNYGDDGGDGLLEPSGADIVVPAEGSYKVVLDLSNPREYTYSLTLN